MAIASPTRQPLVPYFVDPPCEDDEQPGEDTDALAFVITLDDIAHGLPRNSRRCAVARALRRLGYKQPIVTFDFILVGPLYQDARYTITQELRDWLKNFDLGLPSFPDRFVVPKHTGYPKRVVS